MPTLAQLRTILSRYAGANESFTERLNLVLARLLPEGNWKGSKVPMNFVVYTDSRGGTFVTVPRQIETILAGTYQYPDPVLNGQSACYGQPLPVRNGWYETSLSGPGERTGSDWSRGIIPLNGRFTTFTDWDEPMRLRLKFETSEAPGGKIIIRGTLDGDKIYTADGTDWIEGVAFPFVTSTVTTTQTFDRPPYSIIKPRTKGRVRLYTVDADNVETIVAWWDPEEINPSYRRFKVPVCSETP